MQNGGFVNHLLLFFVVFVPTFLSDACEDRMRTVHIALLPRTACVSTAYWSKYRAVGLLPTQTRQNRENIHKVVVVSGTARPTEIEQGGGDDALQVLLATIQEVGNMRGRRAGAGTFCRDQGRETR